jgi:hypothetical protein
MVSTNMVVHCIESTGMTNKPWKRIKPGICRPYISGWQVLYKNKDVHCLLAGSIYFHTQERILFNLTILCKKCQDCQ